MRILWVSNAAFANTGYGVATRSVVGQMRANHHDVAVLAYYGLEGSNVTIDINGYDVEHFPRRTDQWGNDIIEDLAAYWRADLVIIHRDIWVNDPSIGQRVPIAVWFPIDAAPLGERLAEQLKETRWAATMSKWAVEVAQKAGFQVEYIPHSFNPEHFRYARRPDLRQKLFGKPLPGIGEDDFVIMINAANKGFPSRKGFPEMLEAVARFMKLHDNVYLHIHSLLTSEQGGPDLIKVAHAVELDLKRTSITTPFGFVMGIDPEDLAEFYQASDVLLNTSYGEGFGIPLLEAQACGTPVVTTNFSSMPELTFNGQCAEGILHMTPLYNWWKIPDVDDIVRCLGVVYNEKAWSQKNIGRNIATWLAAGFSDAVIYQDYWRPWLERIERELSAGKAEKVTF